MSKPVTQAPKGADFPRIHDTNNPNNPKTSALPTLVPRQTRARSKLPGAEPLMVGVDYRNRPIGVPHLSKSTSKTALRSAQSPTAQKTKKKASQKALQKLLIHASVEEVALFNMVKEITCCDNDTGENRHHCLLHISTSPHSDCECCAGIVEQQRAELLYPASQTQSSSDIVIPFDSLVEARDPTPVDISIDSRESDEAAGSGTLVQVGSSSMENMLPSLIANATGEAMRDQIHVATHGSPHSNDKLASGINNMIAMERILSGHLSDTDGNSSTCDNKQVKSDGELVGEVGTTELHSPTPVTQNMYDNDDLWGSDNLLQSVDNLPKEDDSLSRVFRDMAKVAAGDEYKLAERKKSLEETASANQGLARPHQDEAAPNDELDEADNSLAGANSSVLNESADPVDRSQISGNNDVGLVGTESNGLPLPISEGHSVAMPEEEEPVWLSDQPPDSPFQFLASVIPDLDKLDESVQEDIYMTWVWGHGQNGLTDMASMWAALQAYFPNIYIPDLPVGSEPEGHGNNEEEDDVEVSAAPEAPRSGSDISPRGDMEHAATKQTVAQIDAPGQAATSQGTKRKSESSNNMLAQMMPRPKRSRTGSDDSNKNAELTIPTKLQGSPQVGETTLLSLIKALQNAGQHVDETSQSPFHFPGYQHMAPVPRFGAFYDLNGSSLVDRNTHPGWRRVNHKRGRRCDEVHGCYTGSECERPPNALSCTVCHSIWATNWDRYFQDQARLPRHVDVPGPGADGVDPRMDYIGFLNEDLQRHRAKS